jgi:hypothetical protein
MTDLHLFICLISLNYNSQEILDSSFSTHITGVMYDGFLVC